MISREKALSKVVLTLLRGRKWQYLRYLHLRDSFEAICDDIQTVCVCGAGRGYAELALAIEFPDIHFTLTDIIDRKHGYPNYQGTMDAAWNWGIDNIAFSVWNCLEPTERRFDLVCSTEMLEHIEDDERAAANMVAASNRYVYCLVPYADEATNANARKRELAWQRHEQFVVGYDAKRLETLFPNPIHVFGAYHPVGQMFRKELEESDDEYITNSVKHRTNIAKKDIVTDFSGQVQSQALGIRILAGLGRRFLNACIVGPEKAETSEQASLA